MKENKIAWRSEHTSSKPSADIDRYETFCPNQAKAIMTLHQLALVCKIWHDYSHNSFRTAMQLYRTSLIDDLRNATSR